MFRVVVVESLERRRRVAEIASGVPFGIRVPTAPLRLVLKLAIPRTAGQDLLDFPFFLSSDIFTR